MVCSNMRFSSLYFLTAHCVRLETVARLGRRPHKFPRSKYNLPCARPALQTRSANQYGSLCYEQPGAWRSGLMSHCCKCTIVASDHWTESRSPYSLVRILRISCLTWFIVNGRRDACTAKASSSICLNKVSDVTRLIAQATTDVEPGVVGTILQIAIQSWFCDRPCAQSSLGFWLTTCWCSANQENRICTEFCKLIIVSDVWGHVQKFMASTVAPTPSHAWPIKLWCCAIIIFFEINRNGAAKNPVGFWNQETRHNI